MEKRVKRVSLKKSERLCEERPSRDSDGCHGVFGDALNHPGHPRASSAFEDGLLFTICLPWHGNFSNYPLSTFPQITG